VAVEPHTLPLAGLPDGVAATRVRRLRTTDTGEQREVLVARRLRRTDEVELVSASGSVPGDDVPIDASERRWLLDAGRRQWRSVVARYDEDAWPRAIELVRAGVVRLRCEVNDRMGLGDPRSWTLTDAWERRRLDAREQRERDREY
jgi:hypothetical protein